MDTDAQRISRLLKRFRTETGVTKRALARALKPALGRDKALSEDDLGVAHLAREDVQKRLCHSLRRQNLPLIASELHLDREQSQKLAALSRDIFVIYSGHDPPSGGKPRHDLTEALYLGEIGLEHFLQEHFAEAEEFLHLAWTAIVQQLPAPSDRHYVSALRIGTDLAGLLAYRGETRSAAEVFFHLVPLAERYGPRGEDPVIVNKQALVYKGAAIAARHAGAAPEQVLNLAQQCHSLLSRRGVDPVGQAAVLRDQMKPIVLRGMGLVAAGAPMHAPLSKVQSLLSRSEQLLEGLEPSERVAEERLFTWLSAVECLAVLNRREEVQRLWERVQMYEHRQALLDHRAHAPLASKYSLAEMAVEFVLGRWEDLTARASQQTAQLSETLFLERLQRVQDIQAGAEVRDLRSVRLAFMR